MNSETKQKIIVEQLRAEKGIIVSDSKHGIDNLIHYVAELVPPKIIQLAAAKVDLFFTYSMVECSVKQDGQALVVENTDTGETLTAVGVSAEAVSLGRDYAVMIWLHELAHVLTMDGGHDESYHQYLDYLLFETKVYSGVTIKNDYYELPDDQRPQEAPAGSRKPR